MQTSESKIPARIHAILAREADKAVVFRRGPSSKTAILEWDLQADKFKLGQWFYGSFYPYRCDISPDGRHLVYFAAKYGRGSSIDRFITERVEAVGFRGSDPNGGVRVVGLCEEGAFGR